MRSLGFAISLTACCAGLVGAQTFTRKEPAVYQGTGKATRVVAVPAGIRLSLPKANEFALAPLSESETARLAEPGALVKVGIHRSVAAAALSAGAWITTSEGGRLWRMSLRSPGSVGMRVEFRNFAVGRGKVWLYAGAQVAGPYTGRGTFGNGQFWSATILSESVTIEYEPEAGRAAGSTLPFEISTLSHRASMSATRRRTLSGLAASKTPDPADSCNLDPSCYPEWQPAMSMVSQLLFEDNGSEYLCSGSAVATRDDSFIPYLLTAGHCINNEESARSLETFWTYQTSACGATPPASRNSSEQSTVGGHLLASGSLPAGDYSLVLLQNVPAGVTFSGWDIGDPGMGAPLAGIHHPEGSWKRISFGERIGDVDTNVEGVDAPANLYYQVNLDQGVVEPGSSGSPLFSYPGVIVGTLTFGPESPGLTACQITPFVAGYARFSNAYNYLSDYLENLPAAQVSPSQTDLQFTVTNQTTPSPQTVTLTTQSPGSVTYKLRADAPWIQLSATTGTISAKSPAQVQISLDPSKFDKPDEYSSTVTILSGAAAPQFVNVAVNVTSSQSNVQPSINPNPVVQSGGLWNFTVQLTETGGGGGTTVTALKVNGTDYTSSIVGWFGSNHIAANGQISAPLSATGRFPPGEQYFEFFGVDDGGGQTWYRTVTVRFE
jgi:lysyl endopeptidase